MRNTIRHPLALALALSFLLGIRDGKLALWRSGRAHPEQIYDIRADTLPPSDQLQLRRGIRLDTREEVWLVLENYLD